jgi:hypothetical protein
MDEKLSPPDSNLFFLSQDSIRFKENTKANGLKTKEWALGMGIVFAISIALIVLFNTRSK